jgi:methionine aminotransferase
MSKMAAENNAINLSQGFPDFDCNATLINLVNKYMKKGFNQYAPMPGLMNLREILAQQVADLYGAKYDAETEITITAGATQAIFTAITAVIREGDEVIVFEPAYDCYQPAIELNGGKAVYVQLKEDTYTIDWEQLKKVINHRTKMIIINTPHNPTGSIMTVEDMKQLENLTKDSEIIIISDEVYEHIIFDNNKHQSVARFPNLAARSFIISSFGKTYHTTGWKMGYCLAPKNLMAEFRKIHQFLVFSVNTPIQYALADFLKDKKQFKNLGKFYQEKRDYFINLIKGSAFKYTPAAGTYFQLLNYSNLSIEKDKEYATYLTQKKGIASIPLSSFYHDLVDQKVLRFCFAKKNETLEKAAELLTKIKVQ